MQCRLRFANGIYDAVGVRMFDLPITAERR
jgi:hypothetical protein